MPARTTAIVVLTAIVMCLCQGCASQGARPSKRQAVEIARQVAVQHQEQLERYRPPDVSFYGATRQWQVGFSQKEPYTLGKPETYRYFAVAVDDAMGAATYEAGILK